MRFSKVARRINIAIFLQYKFLCCAVRGGSIFIVQKCIKKLSFFDGIWYNTNKSKIEIQKESERVRCEPVTLAFPELETRVKLLGRAAFTEQGIACDWSASGIAFTVFCGGTISVDMDASSNRNTFFRLYIDGTEAAERFSLMEKKTYILAEALPEGEHSVMLIRDTAVHFRTCFIRGITLNCDPSTLRPMPDAGLLIDFIGTSITCGSGTLDLDLEARYNNESATRAFSFLTAQALNADWIFSSKGTMGVAREVVEKDVAFNLRTLYDSAYGYRDPEPRYVWRRHPDLTVMDIGPNDRVTEEEFIDAVLEFIGHIRELHPRCAILILHGFGTADKYKAAYPEIVARLGGEAGRIWECFTPVGKGAYDGIHPTVEQHRINADVVIRFFRENILSKIG